MLTSSARAVVDLDVTGPTISKHLYGHFAEHLGRCIHDGLYVGEDSRIPNTAGLRDDLLEAFRQRVHQRMGYGGFGEYTDRHLGYGHRAAQDKLRTAEALERLPELARTRREGKLHASAVRELARVATAETESEWIAAAHGRRVREIERLVAGHAVGDRPTDAPNRQLERHVLRFERRG